MLQAIQKQLGDLYKPDLNLLGFHNQPLFQDMRNQLLLQDMLYRECGMICNFGNKSAASTAAP